MPAMYFMINLFQDEQGAYNVLHRSILFRFIPNFMFGLSLDWIQKLYPGGARAVPIIGIMPQMLPILQRYTSKLYRNDNRVC